MHRLDNLFLGLVGPGLVVVGPVGGLLALALRSRLVLLRRHHRERVGGVPSGGVGSGCVSTGSDESELGI